MTDRPVGFGRRESGTAGATLEPSDGSRALSLRVPLPRADDKDSGELVIVLRGGRSVRR